MVVNIESKLKKDFDTVVAYVKKPATLMHIAQPMIHFFPKDGGFPEEWCPGKYEADMKLFGVIPFGTQTIRIEEISGFNSNEYILRDNGSGDAASKWDHWMLVAKTDDPATVHYIDRVDVKAGILTPFVSLFAFVFYSWRQHQWKLLIKRDMKFE